jgi:SMC interacting uncharacterized protein involved in chromosome segregation
MAVSTYHICFNNKLDEFLKELHETFPNFHDFKVLRNGLNIAKTLDEKMPQSLFNEYVARDYETFILQQDEQFFLTHDYKAEVDQYSIDLDIVGKLKEIWGSLDEENKEAAWKYMKVLVLLNNKCKDLVKSQ